MQVCDSLSMRPSILHSIPKFIPPSIHPFSRSSSGTFPVFSARLPSFFSKSLHCRCTMSLLMLMHFWILTGTAWRALKNRALLRWTQMLQVSLNWNALHASLHHLASILFYIEVCVKCIQRCQTFNFGIRQQGRRAKDLSVTHFVCVLDKKGLGSLASL